MSQDPWYREEAARVLAAIESNFSSEQLDLVQDMLMSLWTSASDGAMPWEIVLNSFQILARSGGLEV